MTIQFTTDVFKVDHFKNGSVHILRAIDCDKCREYDFFLDDMTAAILDNSDKEIKITGFAKYFDGVFSNYLKSIRGGLGFNDVFYEYHKTK